MINPAYHTRMRNYGKGCNYNCVVCGVVLTDQRCPSCKQQHGLPSSKMPNFYCEMCFESRRQSLGEYSKGSF